MPIPYMTVEDAEFQSVETDPFRRPEYTATALFDSLFFSLRFIVSYTGAALNIDSVHSTIC
jgi:hypothetical protein